MKAKATLNNYQIGSYAYRVLSSKIEETNRIDKNHTLVVWFNLTKSDINLLKKVIKNLIVMEE